MTSFCIARFWGGEGTVNLRCSQNVRSLKDQNKLIRNLTTRSADPKGLSTRRPTTSKQRSSASAQHTLQACSNAKHFFSIKSGRGLCSSLSRGSVDSGIMTQLSTQEYEALKKDVEAFVKEEMAGNDGSHDFEHVDRVRRVALDLAKRENVEDVQLVEMIALLHDVKDHKYAAEGDDAGTTIRKLLDGKMEPERIERIVFAVENVSYSKQMKRKEPLELTPELAIVQDADRLDAIGAIGIARCFAFGGSRLRPLYSTVDDGKLKVDGKDDVSSFGHFFEKLIHIQNALNTEAGKAEGKSRQAFLNSFVEQFIIETKLEKST